MSEEELKADRDVHKHQPDKISLGSKYLSAVVSRKQGSNTFFAKGCISGIVARISVF
jgi:hypothetical protein